MTVFAVIPVAENDQPAGLMRHDNRLGKGKAHIVIRTGGIFPEHIGGGKIGRIGHIQSEISLAAGPQAAHQQAGTVDIRRHVHEVLVIILRIRQMKEVFVYQARDIAEFLRAPIARRSGVKGVQHAVVTAHEEVLGCAVQHMDRRRMNDVAQAGDTVS